MTRAVVFAYHNVGVRCLKVLLAQGVEIPLVVTHTDNPNENIWFSSVIALCEDYGLPYITPECPNTLEIEAQITALAPDFLFSFYYRHMLKAPLLNTPKRGAYNMHGSLLPSYRGRVPVNWALIHGETETGATLHKMTLKPDNGDIVDQYSIPILPDDTAKEVFDKLTVAAELCLYRALPSLLNNTAQLTPQDLSKGAYFGGRSAKDGQIDWQQSARQIHNLVRAVTHPYPGAFSDLSMGRLILWKTTLTHSLTASPTHRGKLFLHQDKVYLAPFGGGILRVLAGELNGQALNTVLMHLDDHSLSL